MAGWLIRGIPYSPQFSSSTLRTDMVYKYRLNNKIYLVLSGLELGQHLQYFGMENRVASTYLRVDYWLPNTYPRPKYWLTSTYLKVKYWMANN